MRNSALLRILAVILTCSVIGAGWARADFTPIDDFETYLLGPVNEQGGWSAAASSIVAIDPANDTNQVLAVTTDSTVLHRPLLIPEGAVRMLYFRFMFDEHLSASVGMSDLLSPSRFDHFEVELSLTNAVTDLRINDGGTYEPLGTIQPDVWYHVWILVDNAADTSVVYLHNRPYSDAGPGDLLESDGQTVFEFRNGSIRDLVSFYIKTGGGSSDNVGPLYIDDIHLEDTDAINLSNPTFTPPDLDGDGDVDAADYAGFGACLAGPGVTIPPPGCTPDAFELCDIDWDGDVDLRDYHGFEILFEGN